MKKVTNNLNSPINGILLLNKAQGMTSNKALQKAKNLFGAKKAGHSGSLDPLATGMLPVCFGEATKICQYLLDADKCYQTTGLLGIKTNTADSTGEIISQTEEFFVSQDELKGALQQYLGHSKQVPSMFSALKHNGVPLYRLARNGIEIEREARDIQISQLDLTQFDGNNFSLTVTCSKGTYIRNLVEDIGETIGIGAHVTQLHRVYTAGFETSAMYTLDELATMTPSQRMNCLISMDRAINYLPFITLSAEEINAIRQGRIVRCSESMNENENVRLYNEQMQFIGIGEYFNQCQIKAKRLMAF
ncbi:tRNA pseudouridine(55) synthase TruB [Legionella waltersii]|uniref:tRNA pseudouridine synthase B n=1 Tax=Legionella waltersii TaxID=66969 RepID=A0A0W1A4E8_9GAMM|nr:tRNA pseudouridine(55) synthase TruB [Legionella waltersii]KTD76247.1 tRNA pseudouridine synthase B [Legionella waltersii]SNV13212.1 tRNA pseudouridine synthase B [Legionella waltersii]